MEADCNISKGNYPEAIRILFVAGDLAAIDNEPVFYRLVQEASDLLAMSYKNEDLEIDNAVKNTLFGSDRIYSVFDLMLADESIRRDLAAAQ